MTRTRTKAEPLHDIRSDYEIAKQGGRFRRPRAGVSGVGTSGDYHFRSESKWLYHIEYARDLDRNDVIAGMVLDRLIDNVLQETGIRPDPDTGDENLDQLLKDDWKSWSNDEDQCDLAGEMTFAEIERSLLRSLLVDGDAFALPNEAGSLEIIEAHRCRTPRNSKKNLTYGVELDQNRRHLTYYFTKDELSPLKSLTRVGDTVQIESRDELGFRQVFHIANPHRKTLTRGVSVFHRVADAVGMHDDIQFANLVRQQIASCFAIIKTKKALPTSPGSPGSGYGETSTDQFGNFSRTLENISPGMQIETEPGEEIEGFSPNIPNPQFFEHVYLILKLISANIGIPLQAVLLDATQTNFSGWRGAIDQARAGFRNLQSHLIRRFHRHVYAWRVRRVLAENPDARAWASQQGVDAFATKWQRPSWEYIEPLKDTNADIAKKRGLITSPRRIHARRGEDYNEISTEIIVDNAEMYRKARDMARILNAESEDDTEILTWREMLVLPVPDGMDFAPIDNSETEPHSQPVRNNGSMN